MSHVLSLVFVTLGVTEKEIATAAATARFERRRNSQHRWGRDFREKSIEQELETIGSEMALSAFVGHEWVDSPETDKAGDAGDKVQARHTDRADGRLLLHPEDIDDHFAFLIRGKYPDFQIIGFVMVGDEKRQENWKALQVGRPCFVVENERLRDPVEGRKRVREARATADNRVVG